MKKKRKAKAAEILQVMKVNGPLFKCSSCGNTETFIQEGLAHVKMQIEVNGYDVEPGDTEIADFIGDIDVTCAKCGGKVR